VFNVGRYTDKSLSAYQTFEERIDYESFDIRTLTGSSAFEVTVTNDVVDIHIITAEIDALTTQVNGIDEDIETLTYKGVDYAPTANLLNGTATSNTNNSLTDSTKTWTVNQWVDKVVRIVDANEAEEYCLVLSNTADTLTFDCASEGLTAVTYEILTTYYAGEPQTIYAFDIRLAYGALVMPTVATVKERSRYKVYNELANNGDFKTIVMCRGLDRLRGNKYLSLDHKHEGADLYVHYFGSDHYDILNIDAVKRYASVRVNASLSVASATYANIMTYASINHLDAKRFIKRDIGGIYWLKYKSLVTTKMLLTGALSVEKSGGGAASVVSITVRVKRGEDTIDFTDSEAITRLPANDIKSVPLSILLELQKNDEITIIAKRDSGTINILDGSTFTIAEI
jgi:hypothetical protein